MTVFPPDDPRCLALTEAIQQGHLDRLAELLEVYPELATARFGNHDMSRTALHLATDWPGHFREVARTIGLLVSAGTPVNGRFSGPHSETALHWAASSDDVNAIEALLAAGADIEADGAVIAGGTPLADAVGFGQWLAARCLVAHGAATVLWQAAALGLMERLNDLLGTGPDLQAPDMPALDNALWHACNGSQMDAAVVLLQRGAHADWPGWDDLTPLGAAERAGATDLAHLLRLTLLQT